MNFIQIIKANELEQKFKFWSDLNNLNQFYNNLPHQNNIALGFENTEDGYIHYSNEIITYKNTNTGDIIHLRNHWNDADYQCHQQLCSIVTDIRISKISYREIIDINNVQYEYVEISSPNGILGTNFLNWSKTFESNEQEEQQFIDEYVILLKNSKEIARNFKNGIPLRMSTNLQRFKDNNGYYWNVGIDWSNDPTYVEKLGKDFLSKIIEFHGQYVSNKENLLKYLESKWTI